MKPTYGKIESVTRAGPSVLVEMSGSGRDATKQRNRRDEELLILDAADARQFAHMLLAAADASDKFMDSPEVAASDAILRRVMP